MWISRDAGSGLARYRFWSCGRCDRKDILSDVIDFYAYRGDSAVVSSCWKSYAAIGQLWGDFSQNAP